MLSINISELIWTIINFCLLLLLLRHFLFKPICEHMDARQKRIDEGLELERQAKDVLTAEEQRLEAEKQAAREQGRTLLQQTELQAASESDSAIRSARQSARDGEKAELARMQEESRQEGERLSAAEPALAELLARQLLREDGERV